MLEIQQQSNKYIKKMAGFLHNYHITTVHIILFSTSISLLYGFFPHLFGFNFCYWLLLPIVLFIRTFSYHLIHNLERGFGQHTNLGEILNDISGIISDAAIVIALLSFSPESAVVLIVFLICSILTEVSGIISKAITGVRQFDGPMGFMERSLCLGFLSLFMAANLVSVQGFSFVISTIAIFCVITIWIRVTKTLELCDS